MFLKYLKDDDEKIYFIKMEYNKNELQKIDDKYYFIKKKKKKYFINSINKFKNIEFKNSKILSFKLNKIFYDEYTFFGILKIIYKKIGSGSKIIKNSIFNIKTKKDTKKGFYFFKDLGISIQRADSNKTVKEIFIQCFNNKIEFILEIENEKKDKIYIINYFN